MGYFYDDDELYHHGILGQKWGIRRFQNKDGSLTPAGRKRVSEEYKKLSIKAKSQVVTTENYVKAYNMAANKLNNGLIEKYNKDYEKKIKKKLGANAKNHDYGEDAEYNKGVNKLFDDVFSESYTNVLKEGYKNNRYYQKSEELSKKYGMIEWDELAKKNYDSFNR